MKKVLIYTDGSCSGNPGPGGWAAILKLANTMHCKHISGGFRLTTNNRMELAAAIAGLSALKEPCSVSLVSDSQYLCFAFTKKWIINWQMNNWMHKNKKPIPNTDLWKKLVSLTKIHQVEFNWIKGHEGHPENEQCDQMAVAASQMQNLPADYGYEKEMTRENFA